MVAVVMRDDDRIDGLGIDAGGGEVVQELPGRALAGGIVRLPGRYR